MQTCSLLNLFINVKQVIKGIKKPEQSNSHNHTQDDAKCCLGNQSCVSEHNPYNCKTWNHVRKRVVEIGNAKVTESIQTM